MAGQLGRDYNAVAPSHGAIYGMDLVLREARQRLHLVPASERVFFARQVTKWAGEMASSDGALNSQWERFEEALGPLAGEVVDGGGYWMWSVPYAVKQVNAYDWNNKPAKDVSCVGVWDQGAVRHHGRSYFTNLRCEYWQPSGWSNFIVWAKNATQFSTHQWSSGQIGSTASSGGAGTGGSGGGGSGCATQSGRTFHSLVNVGCAAAINIWSAFTSGDPLPDGWSCDANYCSAETVDASGMQVRRSFSWSP